MPFLFSSKTFAAIGIDENSVLVFKVRVQKDKVRMMATNYPNKAKIGECLKLIKKHGIEGQDINGNEIIFEVGARNPEIFTLRIEMPYKSGQLEKDSFNKGVFVSCAKFHEILLPLVNKFLKEPVSDLYALMVGKTVSLNQKAGNEKVAIKKTAKYIDKDGLNTLAKTDSKKTLFSKSKSIVDYKSVKIGKQIWMAENLNVDKFKNGD